jgi:glycosyltransferase involved in cell wall biosynthesis
VKITFVLPHDNLSGGIRVVSIYAERLLNLGHQITVIHYPPWKPSLKERLKQFIRGGEWGRPLPSQTSYFDALNVERIVLESDCSLREIDVPDADIIIATWWETAEWIAPLSPSKGIKTYFVQHYEVFDYLPQERVEATYRLPFFQITIAQWLVDILQDRYQSKEIALVPNGVDLNQFNSPDRPKAARPTVGFIYSTASWKGCDITIQAIAQAQIQFPELRLIAFGLEKPTLDLPLPDGTEYFLQPSQETLKDLYAQCDAWLVGSRSEGFGLPILEAMACRTPVIATPAGAAPELLAEGGGILLTEPNPDLMATAIETICALSEMQWQQMSASAYKTACQHSWEEATQRFEAALYAVVERVEPV